MKNADFIILFHSIPHYFLILNTVSFMNDNKLVYKHPRIFPTKQWTTNMIDKLLFIFLYVKQNLSNLEVDIDVLYKT